MVADKLRYILKEIYSFLTNKKFLLNLLGILVFITVVIWGVLTWLRIYTNHGQQLEMPNYIDIHLDDARLSANERSFEIIVNDSVHIVRKPGGLIQIQNPRPGSLVKEKRKIYVTTTKYQADLVDLSDMTMYGQGYEMIKSALERKGVRTKIRDYKYDPLTNNAILEVWQDDKLLISQSMNPDQIKLEKGSALEFILSTPEGGSEVVQNLVSRTVNTARFMHQYLTLDITYANDLGVDDVEKAIIISQSPRADGVTSLTHGSKIQVTVKAPPEGQ